MTIELDDPPNTQPIHELWAYLSVDENGNEGVCAATVEGLGPVQLIFGYERVALGTGLKLPQQFAALNTTKKIRLVKFTHREVVRTL